MNWELCVTRRPNRFVTQVEDLGRQSKLHVDSVGRVIIE